MSDLIRTSGMWMKPKGQVSKSTCKNTVTSARALVKSHKVFQMDSPEDLLEKSWSETLHKKFTQKRLLWSPFFSYLTTCNFSEREPHHSYFPMTFEKIFQNTVYVRTLVKKQKELKYLSACFSKKLIWKFTKFIQKKLWWIFFS